MHTLKDEIAAADIEKKLSPVEDDKLRALISKLLVKDPMERLSLLDIHKDEFFHGLYVAIYFSITTYTSKPPHLQGLVCCESTDLD